MRLLIVFIALMFLLATPTLAQYAVGEHVNDFSLPRAVDPQTFITLYTYTAMVVLIVAFSFT